MNRVDFCVVCKEKKEIHAFGKCFSCYKKDYKQPIIKCKNCGEKRNHASFDLCSKCYQNIHLGEYYRNKERVKYHKIPLKTIKKVTQKCVVCGFDKIVDLQHLDENRGNNSMENLIGLCPNHHKMIHHSNFKQEVQEAVNNAKKNGY
jgi:RecJ-like exonuclease